MMNVTIVKKILTKTDQIKQDYLYIIKELLSEGSKLIEKRKDIFKDKDTNQENGFNIFESISDIYYRENFHSDILAFILDPFTPTIGNPAFLRAFLDILNLSEEDFEVDANVCVEREASIKNDKDNGRIDILITNNKQALIIENKINNAPDMKDQLVKYMKSVQEERGIKKYKVIYLTLIPGKYPPIDDYDDFYEPYKSDLPGCLKELAAVTDKDKKKTKSYDLVHDFLPKCLEVFEEKEKQNKKLSESESLTKVYIKQYKQLLEHLGVDCYMAETEQEVIEMIFSDEKKISEMQELLNLFSNRKKTKRIEYLGNAVIDYMNTNGKLTDFTEENKGLWIKKIEGNLALSLFNWEGGEFGIGFRDYETNKKECIIKILNKLERKDLFLTDNNRKDIEGNAWISQQWIYVDFNITEIEKQSMSIKNISEYLVKCLKTCENEYKSV